MIRTQDRNTSSAQKRKIRNDIILAVVLLVAAAASLLLWRCSRIEGTSVAVNINGVQKAVYSLDEDQEVVITTGDNDKYKNVMVIRDHRVYVTEANCPDSICVKTRAVSSVGETIVCLPHKLVIEIIDEDSDSDLDMIA